MNDKLNLIQNFIELIIGNKRLKFKKIVKIKILL
jgi:hypothetical protein